MKYLSAYTEAPLSALFSELGVFFAFSKEQFNAKKVEGVEYNALSGGAIVPVGKVEEFLRRVDEIHEQGIKEDLAENTLEGVIERELINHEAYYTGSTEETQDALADYRKHFEGSDEEWEALIYRVYRETYSKNCE